jgi:hypothetical protein
MPTDEAVFTESVLAYLATQRLGRLATVDRDGAPQNNPVSATRPRPVAASRANSSASTPTAFSASASTNPHRSPAYVGPRPADKR